MTKTKKRRTGFRLVAIVRVLALATACALTSLVLLFQVSKARAGDVLTELGAQIMRLPDAQYRNGVQRLTINGMALMVQSGASARPPDVVTTQFYRACKNHTGLVLDERQTEAIEPLLGGSNLLRDALDGIVVQRGRHDSVVACIDSGDEPWDAMSLAEAANRLIESGDLFEIGKLRYALVRSDGRGGSVFLTMWTDGRARLLGLFPTEGDAPGLDLPGLERVVGGRRFLSSQLGESFAASYRHDGAELEATTKAYRKALGAAGYEPLGKPGKKEGELYAFAYAKGRRQLLLTVQEGQGRSVMATLLSSP